jgi:hypothetical protein
MLKHVKAANPISNKSKKGILFSLNSFLVADTIAKVIDNPKKKVNDLCCICGRVPKAAVNKIKIINNK